jgi:hypothetical protein
LIGLIISVAISYVLISLYTISYYDQAAATHTGLSDKIIGISSAGYDINSRGEVIGPFSTITIYDPLIHPPPPTEATGFYTLDSQNIPGHLGGVNGRAIAFDGRNIWFTVLDQRADPSGNLKSYSDGKIYKLPMISGARLGEPVRLGQLGSINDPFGPGFGAQLPPPFYANTVGVGAMDFYKGNLWLVSYVPDVYGRNQVVKYDTTSETILASCYLPVTDPSKGGTDSIAIIDNKIWTTHEDIGSIVDEYNLPVNIGDGTCTSTGESISSIDFTHTGIDTDSSGRLLVGIGDSLIKPFYTPIDSYRIFYNPPFCINDPRCLITVEDITTTYVDPPVSIISLEASIRDHLTDEDVTNAIIPYGRVVHAVAKITVNWDEVSSGTSYPPPPATGIVTYERYNDRSCSGQHADETFDVNPDGTVSTSSPFSPVEFPVASYKIRYSGNNIYTSSVSGCLGLTVTYPTITSAIMNGNNVDVTGALVQPSTVIHDTARLIGGLGSPPDVIPKGAVTYQLFHNNSPNIHLWCTGNHVDETVTIRSDGSVPDSSPFTVTSPGRYSYKPIFDRWSNNREPCESVRVGPSITTKIIDINGNDVTDGRVSVQTGVHDMTVMTGISGTLSGTILYERYNTIDCTGNHIDEAVTINPSGTIPTSSSFTLTSPGIVSFRAIYNGQVDSPCESLRFSSITTSIKDITGRDVTGTTVPPGLRVHDTAAINTGIVGIPATGTVTYKRYDSIDCTGNHVDEIVPVNIGGSVPNSKPFTPHFAQPISYKAIWHHINDVSSPCESLTFSIISTALKNTIGMTITGASVPIGTKIHDTAVINTGSLGMPSGIVTYQRFHTIDCIGDHLDDQVTITSTGTVPDSVLYNQDFPGDISYRAIYNGQSSVCEALHITTS